MGHLQLGRCDPKGYKGSRIRVICLDLYRITAKFPREERYGLTSQIRRSVVSIPSNIAEEMFSFGDYCQKDEEAKK